VLFPPNASEFEMAKPTLSPVRGVIEVAVRVPVFVISWRYYVVENGQHGETSSPGWANNVYHELYRLIGIL
jgi:hypothetical protein